MDLHRRLVDGGLQRLGGKADPVFCRLANAFIVDGVEPEGAAEPPTRACDGARAATSSRAIAWLDGRLRRMVFEVFF